MSSCVLLLRTGNLQFDRISPDGAPLSIGRDPSCDLSVDDPAVSRNHATLVPSDGGLELRDERSRSGTVLNGERIRGARALGNGDWIRIGGLLLLVCDHRPVRTDELRLEALARAQGLDGDQDTEPALDVSSLLYSIPSVASPMAETVAAPQLALLDQVGRTLQSAVDLEEILTVLLGVAFDVLAPERGAVLLADRADGSMRVAISHPDEDTGFVSRTVVDHALAQRSTLVVADVERDARFRGVPSLQASATRAAVCCPLICRDRVVGTLYLDARLAGLDARREEVGLLNLVACYAATAIENATLLRDRGSGAGPDPDDEPLVTRSDAMSGFVRDLRALASGTGPLLLTGEPGTGKLLAARHAHRFGRGPDAPLLVLDCARLSGRDLRTMLCGTASRDDPLAEPGAWSRAGGGTLVLHHVDALDRLAQSALAERLEATPPGGGAPRLIATTSADLDELVAQARFPEGLARRFRETELPLPRLRDRREDILPLARHFLERAARASGREARRMGASAEKTLRAARYREANVRELREAVLLADTLSDGPTIEAEHVFTGPRVRAHRWEVDLGALAAVGLLLRRRVHGALALGVTLFFLGIAVACLAWPDREPGRVANALVWGLWWPGLLFSFAAVGRAWCAVCPLSKLARWGQGLWTLGRRPAAWLKQNARWVMAGLFAVIVWTEQVFAMPHEPFATGVLLLSLMAVAVGTAAFTQREVWCRFACPLGNLSACYSVPATVHVHANPTICQSQCKTHECFKGTDAEPGCPMYLHPLYVRDAHFCKLCMACVRNCPNGSARLWLRPPLQDVWSLGELNPALTPLALTVFLLTPLALAAGRQVGFLDDAIPFTVGVLALALLTAPLVHAFERWLGGPASAARAAVALAILAWGPLMAFHLGHVPGLGGLSVRADPGGVLGGSWPASGVSVLTLLQVGAILLALAGALLVLRSPRLVAPVRAGWVALAVAFAGLMLGMVV